MQGRAAEDAGWAEAWALPAFRRALAGALVAAVPVALALPRFFAWIEARPGRSMHDPLLAAWAPRDFSVATFSVLYATVLVVVPVLARRPVRLLHGLYAYLFLLLLRMASMALLTLEPPPGIIPLVDPVTQVFYPGGAPFLKDLFFSGHTATLALLALLAPRGPVKGAAAAAAVAIGALVLAQHVHWSVDVLAAVPAAALAWYLAGRWVKAVLRLNGGAGA